MRSDEAFHKEDERRVRAGAARSRPDRKKIPWFKLELNSSAKIRFLWELVDGVGLWRHRRKEKPYSVTCFDNEEYSSQEGDCPFCSEGTPKSVEYFWMVYNYTTQQVEIMSFKDTSFTPVSMLRAFYEESQTVLDRDFTIRRMPSSTMVGDRPATSYMAIPNAPSAFLVKDLEVPTAEEIIDHMRPFELGKRT